MRIIGYLLLMAAVLVMLPVLFAFIVKSGMWIWQILLWYADFANQIIAWVGL